MRLARPAALDFSIIHDEKMKIKHWVQ